MLDTVFKYSQVKHSQLSHWQRRTWVSLLLMCCDGLVQGSFHLRSHQSTSLSRVWYSILLSCFTHSCCHKVRNNLLWSAIWDLNSRDLTPCHIGGRERRNISFTTSKIKVHGSKRTSEARDWSYQRCKFYQLHFSMRDAIIWLAIVPCITIDVHTTHTVYEV